MNADELGRILVATSCRDSDSIPKVANAGEVVTSADTGRAYQVMHNGLKVHVESHYGAFNTEVIRRLRGHHEPQEEHVFHEVLKVIPPGGVMLELGSFWAYYSMWFNRVVPGARNLMVEPMEPVLQYGIENFALNGLMGEFTRACVGGRSLASTEFRHWDGTAYDVPQIAVDDFLAQKSVSTLDILHSDIQGAELEMLRGASDTLARGGIGFVFVSTHSEALHGQCIDLLASAGYQIIAEHTLWESFAVDGLIAASHPSRRFPKIRLTKRRYLARIRSRLRRVWPDTEIAELRRLAD